LTSNSLPNRPNQRRKDPPRGRHKDKLPEGFGVGDDVGARLDEGIQKEYLERFNCKWITVLGLLWNRTVARCGGGGARIVQK
jgi:hypothetical protein